MTADEDKRHVSQRRKFPEVWCRPGTDVLHQHDPHQARFEMPRTRSHFIPGQSAETQPAQWRPSGRPLDPVAHPESRPSGKGQFVNPVSTRADFDLQRKIHLTPYNQRSFVESDLLQSKVRAGDWGRDEEFTVDLLFGRHKKLAPSESRNGIGVKALGDKGYKAVEHSDRFHSYGSTVSTSEFFRPSAGHAALTEYRSERLKATMAAREAKQRGSSRNSNRADSRTPSRVSPAPGIVKQQPKSKTWKQALREEIKQQEVSMVASLPEDVIVGEEADKQAEANLAAEAAAQAAKAAADKKPSKKGAKAKR